MNTIKVKLNVDLMGLRKGTILNIGSEQCPMTGYWKNRIKDSKIDNCLTLMNDSTEKKVVKKPTKQKNED